MYLPHLHIIDPRFRKLVLMNCHLEQLWTGGRWLEGPAWFAGGRYLIFSDIPNNRLLRFDDTDGSVSVFRAPSNYANGNTADSQGRLVTCEHLTRRVTRTEHDGSLTVLAGSSDGRSLNSPNDVVATADGTVWFTDPTYGIDSDYEGKTGLRETRSNCLYCVRPGTKDAIAVMSDFVQPNGLAFSPDGQTLYVSDTGATHDVDGPRHIRRFTVADGQLAGGDVFAECEVGLFDGFRIDDQANLWTSSGEGVCCYSPDGVLLGKIFVPEVVSNVCFGGEKRNRLFICGTTSLYATYLNVRGA
jgi:gluconolactonase